MFGCQNISLVQSTLSDSLPLTVGVPQGSVLGLLLFTVYIRGICRIFEKHGVHYVIYADDIQLMVSAHPSDLHIAITKIVLCIKEVKMWLVEQKLKMNDSKTEVILLGHRRQLNQCQLSSFEIDHTEIILSTCVRDLGVWLDAELSFTNHISNVCSASFAYLRVIGRQSKSLSEPLHLILAYSFVVSRVLYCGSIYNGVSKSNLNTLQRVLNDSLCLVTGIPII
jgi:hypothetical protein